MSDKNTKVGEVRPSQLMFSYGVGAIVDLPRISVIVTGLEDWPTDPHYVQPLVEERLLLAVQSRWPTVNKLLYPPVTTDELNDPFDPVNFIGVPVATFPRWMVCPLCNLLAPIKAGLFKLKPHPFYADRTTYVHANCSNSKSRRGPDVVPARFLVACAKGHLDDFPWVDFVHRGEPCENWRLRLLEYGPGGEARDVVVKCETCEKQRRLSDAFGQEPDNVEAKQRKLPGCSARRPHLRDYDPVGCDQPARPIILGASNTWFPVTLSTIAIPSEGDKLLKLVDENWMVLQNVTDAVILGFMRNTGQLGGDLSAYRDAEIWQAIETHRQALAGLRTIVTDTVLDLKGPEWTVFCEANPNHAGADFKLQPVSSPPDYAHLIEQVVLVERLREVRAMIGFTRLESSGELTDPDLATQINPANLSRNPPIWVPAHDVRGEGIFIQFKEAQLQQWLAKPAVEKRATDFYEAHKKWRIARHIEPPEGGFPGMRYVLLHSFAHALMRQFALECGYASASLSERIYARHPNTEGGPMAGVLIYTSAPDSEGTLGGLVTLGQPETLNRHISQALESSALCASDPLCAEHLPTTQQGRTLHATACHACLFASETSCERGNKYLDRSTLVDTLEHDDLAFFRVETTIPTDWLEALEYSLQKDRPLLEACIEAGLPAPEVGYELSDGKKVIAEAELAWEAHKVAVLLPPQMENQSVFIEAGWQVFGSDDENEIIAILQAT